MTTEEIIDEFDNIEIVNSEDYDMLERIYELTQLLRQNADGYLACSALIDLLERNPQIEFGTPGEPVHTIESYRGYYEDLLMESLEKQPTLMTIWMLNRIINGESEPIRSELIEKMKTYSVHPLADEQAKIEANEFYTFQITQI